MSYFGILNPYKLLPDRCNFGSEFQCTDFLLSENGLKIRLKSALGETIIVSDIIASSKNSPLSCSYTFSDDVWKAKEIKDISIVCDFASAGLIKGEKEKIDLEITFYAINAGISFSKIVSGEIFSTISSDLITVTSEEVCQNAEEDSLCDGLDLVFGIGYKSICCSEHTLCCS